MWGHCLCRRIEFKKTEGRPCCHLSVLFRTTQIIQELLFSKVSPQKITPTFQKFNSNLVSPKTFPITNTNPSQTQFTKIYFITYRFKPRSSIYKSIPNSVHKKQISALNPGPQFTKLTSNPNMAWLNSQKKIQNKEKKVSQ